MKIVLRTFVFAALLSVLVASVAYAFVNELQTNNATQTIINIPYYYVDNNTSDVDSNADKGTHSNFTAQQQNPDSTYDTLTETGTTENEYSIDLTGGYLTASKRRVERPLPIQGAAACFASRFVVGCGRMGMG